MQSVESMLQDLLLLVRVVIALALTALPGWERERKDRPAGLRTHMMVGGSACLFVLLGDIFVQRFDVVGEAEGLRLDPLRVIEATVAGVSFLGAGTIFVAHDDRVQGLTTAASLLAAAAVGMLVAVEHYVLAASVAVLFLVVLTVVRRLERVANGAKARARQRP